MSGLDDENTIIQDNKKYILHSYIISINEYDIEIPKNVAETSNLLKVLIEDSPGEKYNLTLKGNLSKKDIEMMIRSFELYSEDPDSMLISESLVERNLLFVYYYFLMYLDFGVNDISNRFIATIQQLRPKINLEMMKNLHDVYTMSPITIRTDYLTLINELTNDEDPYLTNKEDLYNELIEKNEVFKYRYTLLTVLQKKDLLHVFKLFEIVPKLKIKTEMNIEDQIATYDENDNDWNEIYAEESEEETVVLESDTEEEISDSSDTEEESAKAKKLGFDLVVEEEYSLPNKKTIFEKPIKNKIKKDSKYVMFKYQKQEFISLKENIKDNILQLHQLVNNHEEFLKKFHELSVGLFRDFKWDNVFCTGGFIYYCLTNSTVKPNDIDLFVYGEEKERKETIKYILDLVSKDKNVFYSTYMNVINIFIKDFDFAIQIINAEEKNPEQIIYNFDYNYVMVGYNGKEVICLNYFLEYLENGYVRQIKQSKSNNKNQRLTKTVNKGLVLLKNNQDIQIDLEYSSEKSVKPVFKMIESLEQWKNDDLYIDIFNNYQTIIKEKNIVKGDIYMTIDELLDNFNFDILFGYNQSNFINIEDVQNMIFGLASYTTIHGVRMITRKANFPNDKSLIFLKDIYMDQSANTSIEFYKQNGYGEFNQIILNFSNTSIGITEDILINLDKKFAQKILNIGSRHSHRNFKPKYSTEYRSLKIKVKDQTIMSTLLKNMKNHRKFSCIIKIIGIIEINDRHYSQYQLVKVCD